LTMELENFEKLEEKIRQAVDLIDKLKHENQEITSSFRKLEDQMGSFEKSGKNLSLEAERLKSELSRKEREFVEKREEVKRRLQKLLDKLVPLDSQ
jgi:FtsZ-binding cell division protein ZapB